MLQLFGKNTPLVSFFLESIRPTKTNANVAPTPPKNTNASKMSQDGKYYKILPIAINFNRITS